MTSTYRAYIEYIEAFAESHSLAMQAETNIYPLFSQFKRIIYSFKSTIEKFETVQIELISIIEQLKFDENNIAYYRECFYELRKIDDHIQELKGKQVPKNILSEIQGFISDTYRNTSLHSDMGKVEEQVLAKINYTYDLKRNKGCATVILLAIVSIAILSFTFLTQ